MRPLKIRTILAFLLPVLQVLAAPNLAIGAPEQPAIPAVPIISSFAEFSAELVGQPAVQQHIRLLTTDWRASTELILGRAQYYFPIFEAYLAEAQLPKSLKYLAMIESELKPQVKSRHGASGLWQFMPVTARYYGLQVDGMVDERRDPLASTQAAVRLLVDLQRKFRSWPLVLAAYNCGEGRVYKAIRKAKTLNYSKVAPYLPRQTRRYITKFIATAWVGDAFEAYAICPQVPVSLMFPTTVWSSDRPFSFKDLSLRCGLSLKQLRHLNPGYLQDRVPFRKKGYDLILPLASCEQLKKSLGDTLRATAPFHKKTFSPSNKAVLADNSQPGRHPMMVLRQLSCLIWPWKRA
jgi:membrane-bound lytic murein transglycosylase D